MARNTIVKVFLNSRQYQSAFKRSGYEHESDFIESIGLCREIDVDFKLSFLDISGQKPEYFYTIRGGIPMGRYEELVLVDENRFEYSKIKYELYND